MLLKSLKFIRFLHCKGCGSKFHRESPEKWGFKQIFQPNTKKSIRQELGDTKYSKIYENLTPYQLQALQFTPPELKIEKYSSAQVSSAVKAKNKQEKFEKFCRPCIDSKDGRSAPVQPSEYATLKNIPNGSMVMHVIDAYDFPATVETHLLNRPNTQFIISRADLVATHPNQISRFKEYAMQEVFSKANIPASRVHVVSVAKKWGVTPIVQALADDSTYFVGKANSGKSTLVSYLGNDPQKMWPIPFKTRYPQVFSFGDRKLIDTPSLAELANDGSGIYSILRPVHLRKIVAGKMLLSKKDRYNVKPTVGKPGQVVSLGGLVAIEIPESMPGNSTHVWAIHGVAGPLVTRSYGSIDKIYQVAASDHEAHQGWSMTQQEKLPQLEHRLDADATNTLELVVRGLGPVFIKSFGRYSHPNMLKVSALPGVEVYKRSDILPWLSHKSSKREPYLQKPSKFRN